MGLPVPKSLFVAVLIASGVSAAMAFNGVAAASGLDAAERARLEKGGTIVRVQRYGRDDKGRVEAIILVDAPPAPIWRIMTDCDAASGFVPGLARCRVLDAGRNWEIIRHDTRWIWFLPMVSYVFRAEYQPYRRIDFERIRGDLREMKGSWRLESLENGNRTIVRYRVYLDPGFYVPQWIVREVLKTHLPAVLSALRKRVHDSRRTPP